MNIASAFAKIGAAAGKRAPILLAGLAVAGVVGTAVQAIRATKKACDDGVFDEHMDELDRLDRKIEKDKSIESETVREMKKEVTVKFVKKLGRYYLPVIISGALTIGCILGGTRISARRQAALAAAYTLSENTLRTYQEKVKQALGKKKELQVRDDICRDKIEKHPPVDKEIIVTGKGEIACYDDISGRYFKSDPETIRRTVNVLNERLLTEMFISLNDLYYELGLKRIGMGDDLGFNLDSGLIDIRFSTQLSEDDRPCLVLEYTVEPRFDYRSLH